jgi:hypothetical protein
MSGSTPAASTITKLLIFSSPEIEPEKFRPNCTVALEGWPQFGDSSRIALKSRPPPHARELDAPAVGSAFGRGVVGDGLGVAKSFGRESGCVVRSRRFARCCVTIISSVDATS